MKKTFKQLSKLKNPMRDIGELISFINKIGLLDLYYKSNHVFYKINFYKVCFIKNFDKITINFYLDEYKGNIYTYVYCLKLNKIKQARIVNKDAFVSLREDFLKFMLNKELSKLESKEKEKVKKI